MVGSGGDPQVLDGDFQVQRHQAGLAEDPSEENLIVAHRSEGGFDRLGVPTRLDADDIIDVPS